ncbi:MAG: DUF3078 domain-containing protein [Bacteroidales bacterium]|nr:DUF3078 domain-containing protein [Candidatus Cryptobacteroides fimicaballi]
MKKVLSTLAALALAGALWAQDNPMDALKQAADAINSYKPAEQAPEPLPNYWKNSVKFNLGINQVGLANWAAGGYNTFTLSTGVDAQFNYEKDLETWKNRFQMEFGFLYSSDRPWPLFQTSQDRIYLESKWAYKTGPNSKWKYTAGLDFRSQFAPGYKYNTPTVENPTVDDWKNLRELKSAGFSPAYTNLALGIEYVPASWLTINLAPLTGGFTIVSNPLLRKTYGMALISGDMDPAIVSNYRPFAFQFGAQVKTDVNLIVNDKFKFESQLVLFTDYLHEPYIRVNWDNKIEWQMTRLFKIGFYTWLIYDPWVTIENPDKTLSKRGVQFKENVALSFTYTINPTRHRYRK